MKWPESKLSDIASVIMGQSPPGNSYNQVGDGIPLFQGKAEFGETHPIPVKWCTQPTRIAEHDDILLSVRAPVGPTNIADQRCCIGRGLAAIRTKDRLVEQKYLYTFFKYIEPSLSQRGQGSTFAAIKRSEVESLVVPLPPLSEQRRIVEILDQADSIRKKRTQADAKTERILPALFYKMFGDPVTNPKGWPIKPFESFLTHPLRNGLSPSSNGAVPGQVLTLSAITRSRFNSKAVKAATFESEIPADKIVDLRDFLICRGNANLKFMGRAQFPSESIIDTAFPDTMIAARIDRNLITSSFLETIWTTPLIRTQLEQAARTTNGTHKINQSVIRAIRVITPPLSIQQCFDEMTRTIKSMWNHSGLAKMDKLFNLLLHRAFSGDLTTTWREAHMKELLAEMETQAKALEQ